MPRFLHLVAAAAVAASLGAAQAPTPPAGPGPAPVAREDAYRANNVGVALLEQYNHADAAKRFQQALDIDPTLTLAKINLAIALFYVPDLPAATEAAKAAAGAAPEAPQPQYLLGLIAKSENDVEAAEAAFSKVLAIDPTDLGARVNLAQIRMQKREYDAAVELLRPAVASEPYHVTALYNLGVALTRAGKAEEGQQVIAKFQALREAGYGTAFSNNYLEQGRYAEAVASTGAEAGLVDAAAAPVTLALGGLLPAGADGSETGAALVDVDRDGDLDVVDTGGALRILANQRGTFTDASATYGLTGSALGGTSVIAGDYDNDERLDLFVLGVKSRALLHRETDGRFKDATAAAGIPEIARAAGALAFVDADHDGDLDLAIAGGLGNPAGLLLRNNGNGTFADVSTASGFGAAGGGAVGLVPTDYDNRRDVDLVVVRDRQAPALLKNLRDGTFADVAGTVGLSGLASGRSTTVAAGDVNKDGFTDLFIGRAEGGGALAASDGRGGFTLADVPGTDGTSAALVLDLDNDGLLDVLASTPKGLVHVRNLGVREAGGRRATAWAAPVTVFPGTAGTAGGHAVSNATWLAAGDIDQDGDTDLLARLAAPGAERGRLAWLRNEGGSRHASLRVQLAGKVSNRDATGAKIELRAGSLRQKLETASAWPAAAPSDVVFGLGARRAADVVRVIWPAGIVQAELPPADPPAGAAPGLVPHATLPLTELDRKPSSCPYLYTWNGERFEFITDFMGGGEMGYLHAPGVFNHPDPEEYTRIDGSRLVPKDGRYELRVTNELEETLFLDQLRLVVVDHPAGVEVHPREGAFAPPFPPHELYALRDARPVARAVDHAGRDVTDRLAALDRRFVDDLPVARIRGYASRHALTLDLGPAPPAGGDTMLLLTGWTDYAFSTDNVAASQAGLALEPPSLQVRDGRGAWTTVLPEIGIPVGRPQTVAVDLSKLRFHGPREVRVLTSMRVYWDRAQVATRDRASRPRVTTLAAAAADLAWRGFSAEVTPDGREPYGYDYARVSTVVPWKLMPGRYTREGDVRELVAAADDFFVVSRPGDALALSFDAAAAPPLPAGWTRTFLLHSVGYSKEMDHHSASPDQASPLPFRTMTRYPYAAPERYPDTPAHRAYVDRWNTRVVGRQLPPLELAVDAAGAAAGSRPATAAGGGR